MVKVVLINNTEETISGHIAFSIAKHLKKTVCVDDEAPIYAEDNSGAMSDSWNTGNVHSTTLRNSKNVYFSFTWITSNPTKLGDIGDYMLRDSKPIIESTTGVLNVRPIYGRKELSLVFKIHSKSKATMISMINVLKTVSYRASSSFICGVVYYYNIPPIFIAILKEYYRNYVTQYSSIVGFEEWLSDKVDDRLSMGGSQSGLMDDVALVIKEGKSDIVVRWGDKPSNYDYGYDSVTGIYTIEYEFKAYISTPDMLAIEYDIMAYNMPISNYLIQNREIRGDKESGVFNSPVDEFEQKTFIRGVYEDRYVFGNGLYYKSPKVDTRALTVPTDKYIPLFSIVVSITPTDKKMLFNLENMGDIVLHPEIIDYLKNGAYSGLNKVWSDFIYMGVYDYRGNQVEISVTQDLDIAAVNDLLLSETYRALFSLHPFISELPYNRSRGITTALPIANKLIEIFAPLGYIFTQYISVPIYEFDTRHSIDSLYNISSPIVDNVPIYRYPIITK